MEIKEIKIQVPEGYEIDKENSTFECIKFKQIDTTYEDICSNLFKSGYYINNDGEIIRISDFNEDIKKDKNNATNKKQLKRILALNQLLNIAEYYNNKVEEPDGVYTISHNTVTYKYEVCFSPFKVIFGLHACFNRKEDAQTVIDNPNFRKILDTIYKKSLP